jgi:hypothetical protein
MLLEERGALTKSIQARARQPRTGTISFVSARSIDRHTVLSAAGDEVWDARADRIDRRGVSCRDECRRFGTHGRQTDTVACAQLRAASTPTPPRLHCTTTASTAPLLCASCPQALQPNCGRAGCPASCSTPPRATVLASAPRDGMPVRPQLPLSTRRTTDDRLQPTVVVVSRRRHPHCHPRRQARAALVHTHAYSLNTLGRCQLRRDSRSHPTYSITPVLCIK